MPLTMYAPPATLVTTVQEVREQLARQDIPLSILNQHRQINAPSVIKDSIGVVAVVSHALQDIPLSILNQHRQINACIYVHHLLELDVASQGY